MLSCVMPSDSPPDTNPRESLSTLYQENLWLRDLLRVVAQDLERVAAVEVYADHTDPLLRRAQRIRRHLHRGMPEGWRSDR